MKTLLQPNDPQPDDRIAALERRVATLEKAERQHRDFLKSEFVQRSETFRQKLQPKIKKFQHYWPRELKVPASYRSTPIKLPAPTFAIVSPSLDNANFIKATIDSVVSQNYPSLNYYIQDAASSDGTVEVLRGYGDRIGWESTPDRGQAHALNVAFGKIRGDIMGYLNSDDLLMPGTLAYVAQAFAADPQLDVVYGHRICINEDGNEIGRWVLPQHDPVAIKWFDFIPQETMFWRRRVWDELGGFDESFEFALDWDFILRAHAKNRRFARLPRFLGCFRAHDAQKTTRLFEVAQQESERLRRIHLGFEPTLRRFRIATAGYLWRQVFYHRLYKLRVLHY
jgi:glycosyltransferase involved in cell wall biosynthesis